MSLSLTVCKSLSSLCPLSSLWPYVLYLYHLYLCLYHLYLYTCLYHFNCFISIPVSALASLSLYLSLLSLFLSILSITLSLSLSLSTLYLSSFLCLCHFYLCISFSICFFSFVNINTYVRKMVLLALLEKRHKQISLKYLILIHLHKMYEFPKMYRCMTEA